MLNPAILLCLRVVENMLESQKARPYYTKEFLKEPAERYLGMLRGYAIQISRPLGCLLEDQDDFYIPTISHEDTVIEAIHLATLKKYGYETAIWVTDYLEGASPKRS